MKVFYESAYRAYEYDGGLYAIPETQTYNVMFYRKDILEELEIEVPQTWDEVINLLPTIQGNNMEIGIPSPTSTTLPDLSLYYTLLYQNGTDVYDEDAKQTIIDNEAGVNAFAQYTSFLQIMECQQSMTLSADSVPDRCRLESLHTVHIIHWLYQHRKSGDCGILH